MGEALLDDDAESRGCRPTGEPESHVRGHGTAGVENGGSG